MRIVSALTRILFICATCVAPLLTTFQIAAAQVNLTWAPNAELDIVGYKIWYGPQGTTPTKSIDVGKVTKTTISDLTDGVSYSFYASAYNALGKESSLSTPVMFSVAGVKPSIVSGPANVTVPVGSPFTLAVTASGTTPFSLQWYRNGTAITGATALSYKVDSAKLTDAGNYTLKVSNAYGSVVSPTAVVTVTADAPLITTQPQGKTVVAGFPLSLSVQATGTGPLTYQWYKGGVTLPSGTSGTYSVPSAQATDAGDYTVKVSNSVGSATSAPATVSIVTAPVFTTQPLSQNAKLGSSVTLTVSATGTSLQYQWFKNNIAISGATSSALRFASITSSDAGTYTVAVANQAGTITSAPAIVQVIVPPSIVEQPASKTVIPGVAFSLAIKTLGTQPLQYQWSRNGAPVSGATADTLSVAKAQASDAGTYTVEVRNDAGSVTSSQAIVTVLTAPSIETQPVDQTLPVGSPITLSVAASGSAPLQYQWFKDGTPVATATNYTYSVASAKASDSGTYAVRVTNAAGTQTSSGAVVAVVSAPVIIAQPASVSIPEGSPLSLTAQATGGGTLVYQWYRDNQLLTGANLSSFQLASAKPTDSGSYVLKVSNSAGTAASQPATVKVLTPPSITLQPQSQSRAIGSDIVLSVAAIGSSPLLYQWYRNAIALPAETSGTLQVAAADANDAGSYFVKVSNGAGTVTSSTAVISLLSPPSITTQPQSVTVAPGSSVSLSVQATGSGPLSYQWSRNGSPISGATTATFPLSSVQASDVGSYSVFISNSVGGLRSDVVTVALIGMPTILQQPTSQTLTLGASLGLSVTASGPPPLQYQWYFNDVAIPNATAASFQIASVQVSNAGRYTVRVSNPGGTVSSVPADITVVQPPSLTTQPSAQSLPVGSSLALNVTASGTPTLTFQWFKNSTSIPGATSSGFSIGSVQPNDAGIYTVRVSNSAGAVTSSGAAITVLIPPSISTQPASQTVVSGNVLALSVQAAGTAPLQYQWFRNGSALLGENASMFRITSVREADAGVYRVQVSNSAGTISSSDAIVTVLTPPVFTLQPSSKSIVKGASVTLTGAATGSAPLRYNWWKDGIEMEGATSPSLVIDYADENTAGTYQLRASNAAGSATSAPAIISLLETAIILSQPESQKLESGDPLVLSVIAVSDSPLSYQWYLDNVALTRETNETLSIRSFRPVDTGAYIVKVSNVAGDVFSEPANVLLKGQPEITVQPASQTAAPGGSVTLTVEATGTAPLKYRWMRNGSVLQGANGASLKLSRLQLSDQGTYTAEVSNSAGSATSDPAELTILTAPSIVTHPEGQSLPEGSPLRLFVEASGSGPLSYQWSRNGSPLPGATDSSFEIASLSTTDSGSYIVKVSNSVGSASSYPAIVDVVVGPQIVLQPSSQSLASGASLTLSMDATGSDPLEIQWFRNDLPISGATNSTLRIATITSLDAGYYYATVANLAGLVETETALINVLGAPTLLQQPQSQSVTAGSTLNLTVGVSGSAPLQYKWFKNGTPIPNGNGASFQIPSASLSDAANYTVTISNLAGSINSDAATVTVVNGPAITAQPQSKTSTPGTSATFSVSASGSYPLRYQWYFNGAEIPGATADTLVIDSVKPEHAGDYSVKISNSAGIATSQPATLALISAPVIVTQPASTTVIAGANLSLSLEASGPGPLQFQWFRDGQLIPNATSSTLQLNSVRTSDGGRYWATVANGAGSTTSASARIAVLTPPEFTQQPTGQSVTTGSSVTLTVSATGSPTLQYRWFKNGSAISGATGTSLQIASASASDAGSYTVIVSNDAGSVTSDAASISVISGPSITAHPQNKAVAPNASVTFSVRATGSDPIQYQWFFNGSPIPNATTDTLLLNSAKSADAGNYLVKVTNPAGTATSQTAVLTILTVPTITTQPADATVVSGQVLSLTVRAGGSAPLQYQWYQDGVEIPGGNAETLSISSVQSSDAGAYSVTVSNAAGTVTSRSARVSITTPPVITQQPLSQSVPAGDTVVLSVTATGTGSLSYQWYRDGNQLSGATSSTLRLTSVQQAKAGSYTVQVSNSAGSTQSSAANVIIIGLPEILSQPQGQTVTPPAPVSMAVQAKGIGLEYQWLKNGVALAGQNSPNLSIASSQTSDAGSYTVKISNAAGTVTSSPAQVTLNSPIVITTQPVGQTVALNTSIALSVAATGSSQLQYQWFRNDIALPNARGATLQIPSAQPTDAGEYTVTVSSPLGSADSIPATITVLTTPAIIQQPVAQNLAVGATLTLSVQYTGSNPMTLQWYKNGSAIAGATSSTFQRANIQTTDAGTYYVVVTNPVGKATSISVLINVTSLAAPVITTQPSSQTAREGDSVTFSVQATGSGTLMYQWFKNGLPVIGATSPTYTFIASTNKEGLYNVTVGNSVGTVISTDVTLTVKKNQGASKLQALSLSAELNRLSVRTVAGSSLLLRARGNPGQTYTLESCDTIPAKTWQAVGSAVASADGLIEFRSNDPEESGAKFYRLAAE